MTTAQGYVVPETRVGYEAGTVLRNVTLAEARSWECNRCGDCCNGLSEHVKRDPVVDLPLFVWDQPRLKEATAFPLPEDLYESRFGVPLVQPVVRGDGGPRLGEQFERDGNGEEYRSFVCSALVSDAEGKGVCMVYGNRGEDPLRPYNCGAFPVFGMEADLAVHVGGEYIPHTSALPRCTWYGIRIVRD